jgi:hypothetical protein
VTEKSGRTGMQYTPSGQFHPARVGLMPERRMRATFFSGVRCTSVGMARVYTLACSAFSGFGIVAVAHSS